MMDVYLFFIGLLYTGRSFRISTSGRTTCSCHSCIWKETDTPLVISPIYSSFKRQSMERMRACYSKCHRSGTRPSINIVIAKLKVPNVSVYYWNPEPTSGDTDCGQKRDVCFGIFQSLCAHRDERMEPNWKARMSSLSSCDSLLGDHSVLLLAQVLSISFRLWLSLN